MISLLTVPDCEGTAPVPVTHNSLPLRKTAKGISPIEGWHKIVVTCDLLENGTQTIEANSRL
jgi:hypothetical protein